MVQNPPVKAIYAVATRILSKSVSPPSSNTIVLTAPTRTAAYNVKGSTLHTVFSLSKMLTMPYKPLGESTLNTLRQKLEHLKILVIDEISMVDMKLLSYVHGRLCFKLNTLNSTLATYQFWQLEIFINSLRLEQHLCIKN